MKTAFWTSHKGDVSTGNFEPFFSKIFFKVKYCRKSNIDTLCLGREVNDQSVEENKRMKQQYQVCDTRVSGGVKGPFRPLCAIVATLKH